MKMLYLHIGAHRTGTTYLQHALHLNRTELADAGIDTLSDLSLWGQGQHNVAFAYLQWKLRDEAMSHLQYRRRFRERLLQSQFPAAVLSSEFFELFDDAAIRALRDDLPGLPATLIYSVRNQPDYLESYYRESFKQGIADSFADWTQARSAAGVGDFYGVLRRWQQNFAPGTVQVIVYDNLVLAKLNLFDFFARKILAVDPVHELRFPEETLRNASVNGQFTWLLREMNLRHGKGENHRAGISPKYLRMRRRLERAYDGSQPQSAERRPLRVLDGATVAAIESRFSSSNERLLQEFGARVCNPTAGGRMFPPRPADRPATGAGAETMTQEELLDLLFQLLIADVAPWES